jgi:exopolyphosphatase/guanosine-5'-triphosphate,3'-diphosphate pyrophosphatase
MVNSATTDKSAIGIIDLGSNSVLLLVAERGGRILYDGARITRLSEGVFRSGVLAPAAMKRTRQVVREYSDRARQLGAERIVGVGTEALRLARNGAHFLDDLRREGLLDTTALLSGEQEAKLAIEASRRALAGAEGRPVVVDVGGGSSELAWLDLRGRVQAMSFPIGSVRLTEAHVRSHPIPPAEMEELRSAVSQATRGLEPLAGTVVAVAGTATTLAALDLRLETYDPEAVEGYSLDASRLRRWIEQLAQLSVEARRQLPGLEPGRADVIVAGLVVLEGLLERIGAKRFNVSGRGVRHGVALRLLDGSKLV